MRARSPPLVRISQEPADSVSAAMIAEVRRLKVLAEGRDTGTQDLALDRQLPRLIELIAEALDAERATLFLYDSDADVLFSRVLRGEGVTEIRMPATAGIAGAVFSRGIAEIIPDVYQDHRFNPEIDRQTGYRTRNILCLPLRSREGHPVGVTQVLNKRSGDFGADDLALAEAINRHAASALQQAFLVERLKQAQREEIELLTIAEGI